jgi:predicted anti-sigma-YlaC factor YlaD
MLSCSQFLADFGEYLDKAAEPNLRERLEEHLRECKSCSVIVDSTTKTIRIVMECDSFTLPSDQVEPIVQNVMDRIRAQHGSKHPR